MSAESELLSLLCLDGVPGNFDEAAAEVNFASSAPLTRSTTILECFDFGVLLDGVEVVVVIVEDMMIMSRVDGWLC